MPRAANIHRAASRLTVGLVLGAVLLLTACVPTGDSTGTPAAPALERLDGQRSSVLGTSFQYGAFTVTVGYAVYDEVEQALYVGTRWTNLSDDYATAPPRFNLFQLQTASVDEPVAADVVGFDESAVPAGASADVTFAWHYLAADPLGDGELLIGAGDQRVTTIALADGTGENQLAAREVPVDQWSNFGPHTIHINSALVTAGHLSDNSQPDAAHRVLRIGFDVWTSTPSRVGWLSADSLALRGPDGAIVKSVDVPSEREVTWGAIEDSWAEFEIPDDGAGNYEFLLFRRTPGVFGNPVLGNSAVAIPLTIDASAIRPVDVDERPEAADLPLPIVEARKNPDPAAPVPEPGPDRQVGIDAPSVNAAGYEIELVDGTYSPSGGNFDLNVEVTWRGADIGDDEFSVPPSLALPTALEFDERMAGALLLANGGQAGPPERVTLRYYDIPDDFDPDTAVVHLGNNAWISLAGKSAPMFPDEFVAEAAPANAGEFTIDVRSYRAGYFTGADPAPGLVEIEITYDLTTSSGASDHTTFFNPTSQVFLAREDGYVTAASPQDYTGILQLEVGVPQRVTTTFIVPTASLAVDTIYLLLRSRDETDFPTPQGWLETTIPVTLTTDPQEP
jgi:hypothetical protein